MRLTLPVKLAPSPEQHAALMATVERFNAACDWLSGVAYRERCANKIMLQKLAYHDVRARFALSSQLTVRAISRVIEAYKRDTSLQLRFRPYSAVPYDDTFYLYLTVQVPEPPSVEVPDYLGVDLGIVNLAADSDGTTYAGGLVNGLRDRHRRWRKRLQCKGTRSAKRLLKRRRRKEQRSAACTNHTISKRLVAGAQGTGRGIALEDLQGIRDRVSVSKPQRATLHAWSFRQLRQFIAYKARLAGVPVIYVDPRNTPRTCPACGHCDRRNRPTRAHFRCLACGLAGPADTIAAENIRVRGRAGCHAAVRGGCGVSESKHLAASSRAFARSS